MRFQSLHEQIMSTKYTPVPRDNEFFCGKAEAVEVKRRSEEWARLTELLFRVRNRLHNTPDELPVLRRIRAAIERDVEERRDKLKEEFWDGPGDKEEK